MAVACAACAPSRRQRPLVFHPRGFYHGAKAAAGAHTPITEEPMPGPNKVRICMIGAGSLANAMHYPSLTEMEDVEIAATCDLDADRLQQTAARFNIAKTYTDYREMLDAEKPDGVYCLMPPHHLYDISINVLQRGHHLFVEKPPGLNAFQTSSMAKTAAKYGALTMTAFNRRFIPLMREVRRQVEARGPILQFQSVFLKHQFTPPGDLPYYGGATDILSCDAVHAVDVCRWLGGSDVAAVASDVREAYADYPNIFNALIRFENGCAGFLQANWVAGTRRHIFEIHGKGITAYIDPDDTARGYADGNGEPTVLDVNTAAGNDARYHAYGFFGENRHFIDCIKTGRQPDTNFADATKTMELVDAIYHSVL